MYGFWLPLWYLPTFDHCVVYSSSMYGFLLPFGIFLLLAIVLFVPLRSQWLRRAWRYQRGSQTPYIEEEQIIQWPKVGRYQRVIQKRYIEEQTTQCSKVGRYQRVVRSLTSIVLFVPFRCTASDYSFGIFLLLTIVLSVLRCTASEYPFGIWRRTDNTMAKRY
jgi:hypothetical protein